MINILSNTIKPNFGKQKTQENYLQILKQNFKGSVLQKHFEDLKMRK